MSRLAAVLGLALALGLTFACKGQDEPAASSGAGPVEAGAEAEAGAEVETPAAADDLERLLAWMAPEANALAYDRLEQRLDPDVVATVFGIPAEAADLLEERAMLDEGLDIAFDGEAEAVNWLSGTSLAFTVPLSKTPYFVRPLTKPAAELGPLLEAGGFTKNTFDEVEVWLPRGAFPWRIALLDGEVAAFIPVDVAGTGLEPLQRPAEQDELPAEQNLRSLAADPTTALVLLAAGRLTNYDLTPTVSRVEFVLGHSLDKKPIYGGEVHLVPDGDPAAAADELRGRAHPEENKQVQQLIAEVEFTVTEDVVIGRLTIAPDRIKHLLDR